MKRQKHTLTRIRKKKTYGQNYDTQGQVLELEERHQVSIDPEEVGDNP